MTTTGATSPEPCPPSGRRRILLMGEAVTLAHVARPLVLAKALDAGRNEVLLATDARCRHLVEGEGVAWQPITSPSPEDFLRAVEQVRPPFTAAGIAARVEEDLRVIRAFRPHLVVGDCCRSRSAARSPVCRMRPSSTPTGARTRSCATRRRTCAACRAG